MTLATGERGSMGLPQIAERAGDHGARRARVEPRAVSDQSVHGRVIARRVRAIHASVLHAAGYAANGIIADIEDAVKISCRYELIVNIDVTLASPLFRPRLNARECPRIDVRYARPLYPYLAPDRSTWAKLLFT